MADTGKEAVGAFWNLLNYVEDYYKSGLFRGAEEAPGALLAAAKGESVKPIVHQGSPGSAPASAHIASSETRAPTDVRLFVFMDTPIGRENPFSEEEFGFLRKWLEAIGVDASKDIKILSSPPLTNGDEVNFQLINQERMRLNLEIGDSGIPVLLLGNGASQLIPPVGGGGVDNKRGRMYRFGPSVALITYSPGDVLGMSSLKRPVWEDLKVLKGFLA